jgi:type IV pilus assembly protein PilC
MAKLKVPNSVMLRIVQQLALMLEVGVPVYNAVRTLAIGESNKKMKAFLSGVEQGISNGMKLSEAVSVEPTPFNGAQIAMIQAGEEGGFLPKVLQRMADVLEKGQELRRQMKGALTFPIATIVIASLLMAYMLIRVVPEFAKIFKEANVPMNTLTQTILDMSNFCAGNPMVVMVGLGGLFFLGSQFPRFLRASSGLQSLVLGLPAFGQFIKDKMVAEFFTLMGQLIASGVTMEKALIVTMGLSPYKLYVDTVEGFLSNIRAGVTLSNSMETAPLFGVTNAQMVRTGEEVGELDKVMSLVGRQYEAELSYKLKLVTTYAELVAIIISGSIVGTIVYALFIPMMDLSSTVG